MMLLMKHVSFWLRLMISLPLFICVEISFFAISHYRKLNREYVRLYPGTKKRYRLPSFMR